MRKSLTYKGIGECRAITLTTGIDGIDGTAGNDTFKGNVNFPGADDLSTAQTGDILNGGAGVDTFELTVVDGAGGVPLVETNSVEKIKIRALDSGAALDATLWAGVTEIINNKSLDDVAVENVEGPVTISVTNVSDLEMSVDYQADVLGSDTATQAFYFENAGDVANDDTLEMLVGAQGGDVITTIDVTAVGENVVDIYHTASGAELEIDTVIVKGAGSIRLEDDGDDFDDATVVDLSANSGGVTLTVGHEDVVVTGGSGADVITLDNGVILTADAAIDLGAGDDSLLNAASAGVGTDAVLDGGEGADTIASTLMEVGNQANIQNWEVLDVAGDNRVIDASLFTKSTFESLAKTDVQAGNVTVTKLAGTKIVLNDTSASNDGDTLTATLKDATGTADSAEINFNGDGGTTLANFTTAGLETITIDSQSENAGDANKVTAINTTDNVLTKIVITGDKDFVLGGANTNTSATTATADVASTLTLIDGSAATGGLTIKAGAAGAIAATGFKTTYNSLTIKTGEGDDIVSIGGRGTVETGAGADTVNVAVAGVSVNVGTDEVVDAVVLAATADSYTVTGGFLTTSRVTTIDGLAQNDTISLAAYDNTWATAAITDGTTQALTFGSLEAAINDAGSAGATDITFFNWVDGNTYIVADDIGGDGAAVVKLVGTYDTFTAAAGVITIG